MPGQRRRYRFKITESFTPETLPMYRLAEYMEDMATLLGEKASVHFVTVEGGSAVLVQEVEYESDPKVQTRVRSVRHGEGPSDAQRAYTSLNRRLADDNASGELVADPIPELPTQEPAKILDFPGRRKFAELPYGPFNQPGSLQGIVIAVGGEGDPVPVHLEDSNITHFCRAKRPLAKELAQHLFSTPIRVSGTGRWFREGDGQWLMRSFTIADYAVLKGDSLVNVVARLRQLPAKWKERESDPIALLRTIRHGEAS